MKKYIVCVAMALALFSCEKSENTVPATAERNTLNYVVRDNFGLSYLAVALFSTGVENKLMESGPFTLMAPTDDAFKLAGFNTQADVSVASGLTQRVSAHILPGEQAILELPLGMNQPLKTATDAKVYLSRAEKGPDVFTTINGARLIRADVKASNGLMHIIDRFLAITAFPKLGDALAADVRLSLYFYALKQTGLLEKVNGSEDYTLFALSNTALRAEGYQSVFDIQQADQEELKFLLESHIAKGRRFAQDYFLLSEEGQTSYVETMLNGKTITMHLQSTYNVPNSFTGIQLAGPTETQWDRKTPVETDISTGNGVIHILDAVIKQ